MTLKELQTKPLSPELEEARLAGILETYLADEEFYTAFKMDKRTFQDLPKWKRDKLKGVVGVY